MDPKTKTTPASESPERAASAASKGYRYSETFYDYIQAGSIRSASVVVPLVLRELSPASVLDVGCGAGAWLSEYLKCGIADCLGVDGAYVQQKSLLVPVANFQSQDVSQLFDLGRTFDVVQCLEVAEHLPQAASDTLVANLTRHSDKVLFSAATPGQGGEFHINEQTYEYWRALFAERGYKPFDFVRPLIKGVRTVEPWYRRNIVLYVAEAAIPTLPPAVLRSFIGDDEKIPIDTSLVYRIQSRILSLLPMRWVTKIARAKHNLAIACRSRAVK